MPNPPTAIQMSRSISMGTPSDRRFKEKPNSHSLVRTPSAEVALNKSIRTRPSRSWLRSPGISSVSDLSTFQQHPLPKPPFDPFQYERRKDNQDYPFLVHAFLESTDSDTITTAFSTEHWTSESSESFHRENGNMSPAAAIAEKSGWRSRLTGGTKKGSENVNSNASTSSGNGKVVSKYSSDSLARDYNVNRLGMRDESEMAAQHIARQQRAAHQMDRSDTATLQSVNPASFATSSQARLDEYRKVTQSGISSTKLDRVTGSSTGESIAKSSNETSTLADEASCPVCLELLSFRLAGEKGHVVPSCGHALHHACFTAVYGSPESVIAAQTASRGTSSAPGICGVCRKLIVLGETPELKSKRSKLQGIMGVENENNPIREDGKNLAMGNGTGSDDPLEVNPEMQQYRAKSDSQFNSGIPQNLNRIMVLPAIRARPEFTTVYRKKKRAAENSDGGQERQNVVCVVSIQVPARRGQKLIYANEFAQEAWPSSEMQPIQENVIKSNSEDGVAKITRSQSQNLQVSSVGNDSQGSEDEGFSFGATPAIIADLDRLREAVENLRLRVVDWKGHSIERFGTLRLTEFLGVRQDQVMRQFYVYLFREALLCVNEDKPKEKSRSRILGSNHSDASSGAGSSQKKSNLPLKLKGRIWIRHIRCCVDVSIDDEPCLSIRLEDDSLDEFVLCFSSKELRDVWRKELDSLIDAIHNPKGAKLQPTSAANTQRRPSVSQQQQQQQQQEGLGSPFNASGQKSITNDGSYSSHATLAASNDITTPSTMQTSLISSQISQSSIYPAELVPNDLDADAGKHHFWSASGGLNPALPAPELLPHAPIDLVIMVSLPTVAGIVPGMTNFTTSSSASVKQRLVRSTLESVVANLGAQDRIALVTFTVGSEGVVRRTALLNGAKESSRNKLDMFIESMNSPWQGPEPDPFIEEYDQRGGNGDQVNVVTAVNVGLDIVLQRKSKNPVTGMILINDTADVPKRTQMDLIMARAEAAKVPIHCFGFGKSHDPASLWLISNHTRGSYTFVKEWFQLRECVAGCIGGLLSVALTNVKLHVSVPLDNHFRIRKVTGCIGSVISANGKDVDLDLNELRFGECKELMLELELNFTSMMEQYAIEAQKQTNLHGHYEKGSATDDFMQRLGLQNLSIATGGNEGLATSGRRNSNARDSASSGEKEGQQFSTGFHEIVDDIAVFEVGCACRDPIAGIGTIRLPEPCVLMLEVDSASNDPASEGTSALATALSDPVVTRRRLEILVSDMITRCALLVSRKNHSQALKLLLETRRIVETVLHALPINHASTIDTGLERSTSVRSTLNSGNLNSSNHAPMLNSRTRSSQFKKQREILHFQTASSLTAILDDLDVLIDGLETGKITSYERCERNFGAQQAMILRDQKSWTSRSETEWKNFKNFDNGSAFVAKLAQHISEYGVGRV